MKPKILVLALAASAALCLAACSTTQQSTFDNGVTIAEAAFQAAKTTVETDAQAGLIDAATARQVEGYIVAGDQALDALQAAVAAGNATSQADQVAAIIKATAAINNAVLLAVQAHNGPK